MHEDGDDSFVSINLETSESCGLCGLDTGERLVSTCQLCVRQSTLGPFQIGFNEMPDVMHSRIVAHESCLSKSHRVLTQARRSFHSPLLHRRGNSVPNDVSSLGLRETFGLQWIINYAKNEDIKNKQNHLQVHSSPCTRSSSPNIFKAVAEESLLRRNSENNLKEPGCSELRKSYTKYLYGSTIPKSHSDDINVGCKTHSRPNIAVDDTEVKFLRHDTKVPDFGNVKGQTQWPTKTMGDIILESKTQSEGFESTDNNKTNLSTGSKPISQTVTVAVVREEDEKEKVEGRESQHWSNKYKTDKEQLNEMTTAEIKKFVSSFENIIKAISGELVDLLQERDALGQETRSRNLTIQKLVKMKHSQQDAPIKTTGIGNI